jgi:hypothetical protein
MTDPPPKPLDYETSTPPSRKVRRAVLIAILGIIIIFVVVCGIYALLNLWDFPPDQD